MDFFSDAPKLSEEQYILRTPEELGERIRKMVQNDELSSDQISFLFPRDSRVGQLFINGIDPVERYKVTLCDLPCVVETHRTEDNRVYYKSGDVGQILLVQKEDEMEFGEMDEQPNIPPLYDNHYNVFDGLTPPTKNIRKRKYRQKIKYSPEDMKEAQAEILRIKSGGNEYDIEEISVKDVDEYFELPQSGNVIMTMKDGKPPIRAGYTHTFTDAELDLLPDIQKELAKAEEAKKEKEVEKIMADFEGESDHSVIDGPDSDTSDAESMMPPQKKFKGESDAEGIENNNNNMHIKTESSFASLVPKKVINTVAQEQSIKNLRCKKIDVANEIMKFNNKIEAVRMMVNLEQNITMKARLQSQISKITFQIAQKKQEMSALDIELAKFGEL
jgi:transcription initiation factor TFIID subunit 7